MILADQGADVIKVEPTSGDIIRHLGTGTKAMSSYFANLNRSKRSIAVNLHEPKSRPVLEALLDSADVVVQSFRPSAAKRLGLDAPNVVPNRPALIYASIVGFGGKGPYAGRPVYDHVVQALSGMADLQRESLDDVPHLVRHGLIDKSTGYVLAESVCAAFIERLTSGVGTTLEINMLDVAVSFLWPDGMMDHTALKPEFRRPSVATTFRLTPTLDGHVALVVLKQEQWDALIKTLEMDTTVEAFQGPDPGSGATPGQVLRAARKIMARMPTDEVVQRLSDADVPCAPVLTPERMVTHPQIVANETLIEYEHPLVGPIRQPQAVPRFASMAKVPVMPAPGLGGSSREIMAEIGVAASTIEELIASGTVVAE